MSLSQLATNQLGWGFHTMRGGINPGDLRVRPRVVRVVEIWKDSNPAMRPYPPRVWRDFGIVPRGNSRRALVPRAPAHQQPASWVGVPHLAGRYRPGGSAFSSSGCWSYKYIEAFSTRGWERILSGCGGTSALARDATLAARWLNEPQPISNQPVGLGFPHRAGRYRRGGSAFSSPGCWSCRYMELPLTRRGDTIIPGCC